jgi:hypothetical protein
VQKPPLSLILLSLFALILMAWAAVNSLHILWFGSYLDLGDVYLLWFHAPDSDKMTSLSLSVQPDKLGWPLLVLGLSWPGALAALWLGMKWGPRFVFGLFLLSLLIFGFGSLLALLGLICHTAAPTQRWLAQWGEAYGV